MVPVVCVMTGELLDARGWDAGSAGASGHERAAVSLLCKGVVRHMVALIAGYCFRRLGAGLGLVVPLASLDAVENAVQ